jgi:ATP-dependent DNA helicase RecQ
MKLDTTNGREREDAVESSARSAFGIEYLFPWQRLVIANILDAVTATKAAQSRQPGKRGPETDISDCDDLYDEDGALRGRQIVLLPTGAGKSLCFQVPALLLDRATLVIYPLLALMGDQTRRMAEAGLEPVVFRGGQSAEERSAQFRRMEGSDGKPPARLIIANPEVLASGDLIDRIAARGVDHLAIDEAHCVSEWGDTFRPAYLELGAIVKRLKAPAVTAFTATASPAILERIAEILFAGRAHLVRGDADRPNIEYAVNRCGAKDAALIREAARRERPTVVFCATRGGTERAASLLRSALGDDDIRFYHAGLERDEKTGVESWFHGHGGAILCATCAWGLGVDKKDVRTVIHRDAPPTAESYVQESGRAGRDGKPATAVLLWSQSDRKRLSALPGSQRERAEVLIRLAEGGRCRREVLLEALGDPRAGDGAPGGERFVCSGCDVCRGTAVPYARDTALVLDFIRRNNRCRSRDEIVGELYAAGNRVSSESGYMGWRKSDFAGILGELEREGKIRTLETWPLKGKIALMKAAPFPSNDRRQGRFGKSVRLSFMRLPFPVRRRLPGIERHLSARSVPE